MSIIERYSPLNQAYRVAIVTNASSPLGITVCNTLLKSNALVLGTDNKPVDPGFSESPFTHFQFHKCNIADSGSVEALLAYAREKFKKDTVNAVVCIAAAGDDDKTLAAHKELALACAKTMKTDGGVSVVNTLLEAGELDAGDAASKAAEKMIKATKETDSEVKASKGRCNMIAPSGDKENVQNCQEFDKAKPHLDFLYKPSHNPSLEKNAKPADKAKVKQFDFSNVALVLASDMSEGLHGAALTPEGSRLSG